MADTMTAARRSQQVRLPETFGPAALKVGLKSDAIGLGPVVFDALVGHFGSVKALAYFLQADPSLSRREILSGDFSRIEEHADDVVRGVIAAAVHRSHGLARNADDHAEQCLAQIVSLASQLVQYVAFRRTS